MFTEETYHINGLAVILVWAALFLGLMVVLRSKKLAHAYKLIWFYVTLVVSVITMLLSMAQIPPNYMMALLMAMASLILFAVYPEDDKKTSPAKAVL